MITSWWCMTYIAAQSTAHPRAIDPRLAACSLAINPCPCAIDPCLAAHPLTIAARPLAINPCLDVNDPCIAAHPLAIAARPLAMHDVNKAWHAVRPPST